MRWGPRYRRDFILFGGTATSLCSGRRRLWWVADGLSEFVDVGVVFWFGCVYLVVGPDVFVAVVEVEDRLRERRRADVPVVVFVGFVCLCLCGRGLRRDEGACVLLGFE